MAFRHALIAIALVFAGYVMHGVYIYWDAKADPRLTSHPVSPKKVEVSAASTPASPTAPWAENYARLQRGEYATLVDNAWSAPEKGSLAMAAKALYECSMFMYPDSLKRLMDKINAAAPSERDLRLEAFEKLRAPCRPLEGRPELFLPGEPYAMKLHEADRAGPYNRMLEALNDHRASKSAREARLREYLASNDPLTMSHVVGYFTRPDSTFEGERIPWVYRGAYLTAWQQVMCANYDQCYGPDSRQGLRDCANHGSCPPISPEVFYRIFFPTIFFGDRSEEYYRRIQAHLDRRRYDVFGLP